MLTLRPRERIKKRKEFLRIQEEGSKSRTKHFLVVASKSEGEEPTSRIGITITRKVDRRAVGRNYVKRHVREFFRHQKRNLREPLDIVVVALHGSSGLSSEQIGKELWGTFKKGQLFKQTGKHKKARSGKKTNKSSE